jgi:ATP-dependent Lhr-like helicase
MSAESFALLHLEVQKAIHRMGWKELHYIQSKSIEALLGGEGHLLVSAQTAGGKTEAAFLPIISRLAQERKPSVQALYVGPLVALINDQFQRLERLCEAMEMPVHRWHGGASATEKKKLREQPGGILLITPESLESNFINYGSQLRRIYAELEFVVIDELHSFLSNVRGVHLRSLLTRLFTAIGRQSRMVGLSATLGDPSGARAFLAPAAPESVVLVEDTSAKRRIQFGIKSYLGGVWEKKNVAPAAREKPAQSGGEKSLPPIRLTPAQALQLAEGVSEESARKARPLEGVILPGMTPNRGTGETKAEPGEELEEIAENIARDFGTGTNLIFGNAKRALEDLADRLNQKVEKERWPRNPFLVHHGSLSKALREEVEQALKTWPHATALCSSTLEMGIDIGSVRRVGQLDPPWSVASLVQRMGRSGRRDGEPAIMRLYTRDETPHAGSTLTDLVFPKLLRAIALSRLMLQKWLEPPESGRLHLSTLVHQILSCLRQTGGMSAQNLYELLVERGAFSEVSKEMFATVCKSLGDLALGDERLIEQMPTRELILAPEGERVTADFDFYAAFASTEEYAVRCEGREIGKLQATLIPPVKECLILAGRRWVVKDIIAVQKTVEVAPATGGKAPLFRGVGLDIHARVVAEMRAVLLDNDEPVYVDEAGQTLLSAARRVERHTRVASHGVLHVGGGIRWYPWLGTRALRTLELHAKCAGLSCRTDEISIGYADLSEEAWRKHLGDICAGKFSALELARKLAVKVFEKFDGCLSEELQDLANARDRLDLAGAAEAAGMALRRGIVLG